MTSTIDDLLKKLQYKIGGIELKNIPIRIAACMISKGYGIYGIQCRVTNKILVGEGKIGYTKGNRIISHLNISTIENQTFKQDFLEYGEEGFILKFYRIQNDPIMRKYEESLLHTYYIDEEQSYNTLQLKNGKLTSSNKDIPYYGVHKKEGRSKYEVSVSFDGVRYRKYGFDTAEEAAKYYDIYVLKNMIPRPLNFPDQDYSGDLECNF